MRARVSNIEAFRYWQNAEDQSVKELIERLTTFQPNEHVLQLGAAHVMALATATTQLGETAPAAPVPYDDFVIDPQ